MIITNVQIHRVAVEPGDTASASIFIEDSLAIHGFRILWLGNEFRVIMPTLMRMRSCNKCHTSSSITGHFCIGCGARMGSYPLPPEAVEMSIVEPLTEICRAAIISAILNVYDPESILAPPDPPSQPVTKPPEKKAAPQGETDSFGEDIL